jgi:hypothetical protein
MRQFLFLLLSIIIVCLGSCRSDFETVPSNGKLAFSKDTLFLDTVFSTISSSTFKLKVYNRSKNDITIPTIKLGKGLASKYRMTVDGMTGNNGKLFENVPLLAQDSLFIFVETTVNSADANPKDMLYTDQIQFDGGSNFQKVELVTLVQDAVFLYSKKTSLLTSDIIPIGADKKQAFYLNENDPLNGNELKFTNKKAYVIYGYAAVPAGKTLEIDPGARVYFHTDSGIVVGDNATIHINGGVSTTKKLINEVIFQGDRIQPDYNFVPGQWGTIWLTENSINNKINHLTLKNATIGLKVETKLNALELKNTQIYDCSTYGVLAQNTSITAENTVISNAGLSSLACILGGQYSFTHCTFNNDWSSPAQNSVLLSNSLATKDKAGTIQTAVKDLTKATFNNCIIYGSYTNELFLDKKEGAIFNYQFNNCLIRFNKNTTDPLYLFNSDAIHYNKIVLNEEPKFFNPNLNKFNIDATSGAFANGSATFNITQDIEGNTRTIPPDLGAYQSKTFPKAK